MPISSNPSMLYTYFKPVVRSEHYLFAGEIAQQYNILTRTGKVADSFVSAYLQDIARRTDGFEQLYYSTRYGMTKVYPRCFYDTVMRNFINSIGYNKEVKITLNNKNYYIKVVK